MKKIVLLNLCVLYLTSNIFAAPFIIDSRNDVISGSGFGTKRTPVPMKWENFEMGVDGEVIAGDNVFGNNDCDDCWSDYAALTSHGTEAPKYSSMNNKRRSTLNSRHHFVIANQPGKNYSDSILAYEGPKELTDKVFVSFWVRWDWGETEDTSYQQKIFRMVNNESIHCNPGISVNNFQKEFMLDTYNVSVLSEKGSTSENPMELKHGTRDINPFGDNEWGMLQMWVKAGAIDDGEIHMRYFLVGDTKTSKDWTGTTLESGLHWKDFLFGLVAVNVEDPHTLDATYHFDDIYIDDSWARVEIGNSPTYEKCTHREMQIPSEWNDTEITITKNQGLFLDGTNGYLFVIDEDGVVSDQDLETPGSQGYEITFETSGDNYGINGDDEVNTQDVIMCVYIIIGTASGYADVNGDGLTNVFDVITLVNEILTT